MNRFKDFLSIYNQILFAVGVTGFVAVGCVALLGLASSSENPSKPDIVFQESPEDLRGELKVSLESLDLVNGSDRYYVVPVSRVNYEGKSESGLRFSSSYYSRSLLNNLIVYDDVLETSTLLFEKKIAISHFWTGTYNQEHYIFAFGADLDSNSDNKLDRKDKQKLFVYSVKANSIEEISDKRISFIHLNMFSKDGILLKPYVFVSAGVDLDENGEFDKNSEPVIYYGVNFLSNEMREVVQGDLLKKAEILLRN